MQSIGITHASVSSQRLERYVKEFEFRFNRRNVPASMFTSLISEFPEGGE
jgi:transposase-like protein